VDAVVREVAEEAGLAISVTGLAGVYSDPSHVLVYADEGARQQLAICFHARPRQGDEPGSDRAGVTPAARRPGSLPASGDQLPTGVPVRPDHLETVDAMWANPGALDGLAMHPAMRRRVNDAVSAPDRAHFD
jgi:ADP-ribose pyrophosphatase YjhB (NUDIX family)